MPYFRCLGCGAVSYSAARKQSRDECPVCGRPLTEEQDVSEDQVRDYLYRRPPLYPPRAGASRAPASEPESN